ncbi:MAG TPA: hypothetical protein DIW30_04310 [Bacteroidales bacterium]|nr:hypothetical protein [Bacteroidales bacterium]
MFFVVLSTSVLLACAQTAPVSSSARGADVADSVYRTGNTYVHDGQVMNKRQYLDFLSASDNKDAYGCFRNGYRVANVGWGLFGGGLIVGGVGLGLVCAGVIQGANNDNNDFSTSLGTAVSASFMIVWGTVFSIAGGMLEIAAIPTISVGYARMHKSVDVYNIPSQPQTYVSLGLSTSTDGIGLALHF